MIKQADSQKSHLGV